MRLLIIVKALMTGINITTNSRVCCSDFSSSPTQFNSGWVFSATRQQQKKKFQSFSSCESVHGVVVVVVVRVPSRSKTGERPWMGTIGGRRRTGATRGWSRPIGGISCRRILAIGLSTRCKIFFSVVLSPEMWEISSIWCGFGGKIEFWLSSLELVVVVGNSHEIRLSSKSLKDYSFFIFSYFYF